MSCHRFNHPALHVYVFKKVSNTTMSISKDEPDKNTRTIKKSIFWSGGVFIVMLIFTLCFGSSIGGHDVEVITILLPAFLITILALLFFIVSLLTYAVMKKREKKIKKVNSQN